MPGESHKASSINPNILITGGRGAIGSRIVEHMIESGAPARLVQRSSTLQELPESIDVVQSDLMNTEDLARAMEGIEVVLHLAGTGSPSSQHAHAKEMLETNVVGTLNLFEAAIAAGVRRVVFASSAAVYGPVDSSAISETMVPAPASPYGVSKFAQELVGAMPGYSSQMDVVALRLFNVYGGSDAVGTDNPKLIPALVNRIGSGQAVTVFGDGQQRRDFVHVDDVADAFEFFAVVETSGFDVFNIGTGVGTTILDVIHGIEEALGVAAKIDWKPERRGEVRQSIAMVEKANHIGFAAKTYLADGLARYVRTFLNSTSL